MPSPDDPVAWPWSPSHSLGVTGSSHSGGGYVAVRKTLLARFAAPWLRALHELDRKQYAQLIFDYCSDSALSNQNVTEDIFSENVDLPEVSLPPDIS